MPSFRRGPSLRVRQPRAREVADVVRAQVPAMRPGGSDVDIGVRGQPGQVLDVGTKVRLALALEGLLGADRVDLVDLESADPFLALEVVHGERLYARDEDDADEYDLYILRRAGDLVPFERQWVRRILEGRR